MCDMFLIQKGVMTVLAHLMSLALLVLAIYW